MDRIDNVDLREALQEIAQNNTYFHLQHDLNISLDQMERAVGMDDPAEKMMLWVSYPDGIDCYSERQAFQQGTRDYNGVQFHGKDMQRDRKLAYAVELIGSEDGKLRGNLFQMDITAYAETLRQNALPSDTMRLYHDDGRQSLMAKADFDRDFPYCLQGVAYYRNEPTAPIKLHELMDNAQKQRNDASTPRDMWLHTSNLFDGRREFYTNQLLQDLGKLKEPNDADKHSFSVKLDFHIAYGFGPEQLGQLLEKLPYKNAMFAVQRGKRDMNLVVPRDEVMQQRQAGKEKPSVLAKLQESKAAQAQRPAAQQQANKTKNTGLEM